MKSNALVAGRVEGSEFIVLHMALYKEFPTEADINSLRDELLTDEEFGLQDEEFEIKRAEIIATVSGLDKIRLAAGESDEHAI